MMQKKLGVLRLEGWGNPATTGTGVANPDNPKYEGYVPLPGDIDDTDSYDFDFVSAVAWGCTFTALCTPENFKDPKKIKDTFLPGVESAVKTLIKKGAQAIIANCGLFMWLHATGVVDHAVDNVMKDLAKDKVTVYIRPYVKLSSLTTLSSTLATLGVGTAQKEAAANWESEAAVVKEKVPVCKAVVYTSNGNSCKKMLEAVPQLKGLKIITPDDKDKAGDVLVVGLDGDVVIGLDGKVGGDSKNGFIAVKTGQPVFYDIVQPYMYVVANAVKQKYPHVCIAYVECTEVSAYSDTIRKAMQVPVFDPINLANDMIDSANNHNFHQKTHSDRISQISETLHMPVNKLAKNSIIDAQPVGEIHLQNERQLALAKQKHHEKLGAVKVNVSKRARELPVEEEPSRKAQRCGDNHS